MPEGFPQAETANRTSLFEQYADLEVTIKGITGKMGNLIALCPVPVSEMDPQKKEEWTADILVEAGVTIPEEHITETLAEYLAKKK